MAKRQQKFPDNGFEAWGGYMNAKIAKLEEQFTSHACQESSKKSDIFKGISIYVNGFTMPSAEELKELMAAHGGTYHTYQRANDYIIATNLPDTKVKNMSLTHVVRPEWIVESIAAHKLLDYRDYLLYKNSRTQGIITFNKITKSESSPKSDLGENDFLQTSKNSGINMPYSDLPKQVRSDTTIKTAADPNFISEFYNNSRLHHISQLGACFKQHINDLRENSKFDFPALLDLKEKINSLILGNKPSHLLNFESGKVIMHIDMDCFFVSVGLRNRPHLKGKPVAVTHSKGGQPRSKRPGVDRSTEFNLYKQKQAKLLGKVTGIPEEDIIFESRVDNITDEDDKYGSMSEIASCSYEARAKGIKNGMFMGPALKLCPDLLTIPYDFEGYKEVAFTLYNSIAQYTLDIEAVSCDEMYVDCTNILKQLNVSAENFAVVLREEIKMKTGCPCSTGFGGNRLQARLATKKAKPDGQFFLTADLVQDFMYNISLKELPGVGRQTAQKLEALGHSTCGSLQNMSLQTLQQHLGMKTGVQLYDQCRGRDINPLSFHTIRKSVSAEVNYGIRFENDSQCINFIKQLAAEVQSRMEQFKVLGKCITLKLMTRAKDAPVETAKFMGHGFCNVINKSSTVINPTNNADIISQEILTLIKKLKIDPKEMRGIGIQITKLEPINTREAKVAINNFFSNTNKLNNKPDCLKDSVKDGIKEKKLTKQNSDYTSPIKRNVQSPTSKSPVLGILKSPRAKRRGRPPKTLGMQLSTSKSLMSKFLNVENVVKPVIFKQVKNISFEEVDIMKDIKPVEPKRQGLLGLPWKEVRELLKAWLNSGQTPMACDTNLLAEYMCDMVITRNIEKLNVILNFLHRRSEELDSADWKNVYEHVLDQVQNAMIAVYGKRLYISE